MSSRTRLVEGNKYLGGGVLAWYSAVQHTELFACLLLHHLVASFLRFTPSPYPSFTYSTLTIRSDPIWNNSFGCWGERIRNKARGVTLTHTTRRRELSIYIQIRTGQKSCNIKKGGEDFCVHYYSLPSVCC